MRFSLLPTWQAGALTELSEQVLLDQNIQLLMMDFDNTIVPYTTTTPTPAMDAWLRQMNRSRVKLCVVSNSRKDRVKIFCADYGIDCITHARKPFSRGIRQCLRKYAIAPECCALVGDQIFTDTLGANCAGVRSVLIPAINNHNFWLKARHVLELPFIYATKKRRF